MTSFYRQRAMPCLRWLVADCHYKSSGFNPRQVYVGFVVDKVALDRFFFFKYSAFPLVVSRQGRIIDVVLGVEAGFEPRVKRGEQQTTYPGE